MTPPLLTIIARGVPVAQGNKRFVGFNAAGRAKLMETTKGHANWRDMVRSQAWAAVRCCPDPTCGQLKAGYPLDGPLVVAVTFTVRKPASAPKTRVTYPSGRPDLSKLLRAVEDSLTDVGVWVDDARVTEYARLAKVYPDSGAIDSLPTPGAVVKIWRWADLRAPRPVDTLKQLTILSGAGSVAS